MTTSVTACVKSTRSGRVRRKGKEIEAFYEFWFLCRTCLNALCRSLETIVARDFSPLANSTMITNQVFPVKDMSIFDKRSYMHMYQRSIFTYLTKSTYIRSENLSLYLSIINLPSFFLPSFCHFWFFPIISAII